MGSPSSDMYPGGGVSVADIPTLLILPESMTLTLVLFGICVIVVSIVV